MKTLKFIGSSQKDLADFPAEARREAGFDLWQVQLGLMPRDFKTMLSVGAGAYEIRIKIGTQWRVIYVANRENAIYVLHAFQKTSQKRHRSGSRPLPANYGVGAMSKTTQTITESSGNVFLDMGFPPGEAAVLALRADLMGRLRLLVESEGWTQQQAAERFGIAQSRVSDLVRGKWDKFSLDMLITLAARAGHTVELSLA